VTCFNLIYTKQQIKPSLTANDDNVYQGQNKYMGQKCGNHLVDFP